MAIVTVGNNGMQTNRSREREAWQLWLHVACCTWDVGRRSLNPCLYPQVLIFRRVVGRRLQVAILVRVPDGVLKVTLSKKLWKQILSKNECSTNGHLSTMASIFRPNRVMIHTFCSVYLTYFMILFMRDLYLKCFSSRGQTLANFKLKPPYNGHLSTTATSLLNGQVILLQGGRCSLRFKCTCISLSTCMLTFHL